MLKKDIENILPFYQTYIDLVEDDEDLFTTLQVGGLENWRKHEDQLQKLGDLTYADGKWTIPQLIQHIIDTERIFAFRALAAARNEPAIISGYDENYYAKNAKAFNRSINELLEELECLRKSTWMMFNSFDKAQLKGTLYANNTMINPVQIGFILIGHARHHFNIVKERYFPLIN